MKLWKVDVLLLTFGYLAEEDKFVERQGSFETYHAK